MYYITAQYGKYLQVMSSFRVYMILLLWRTAIVKMREVAFNLISIGATSSPAMKLRFVHVFLSVIFIPLISFWAIKSLILNSIKQTKQWPWKCLKLRNCNLRGMYTAHTLSNVIFYSWYQVTMTFLEDLRW